MGLSKSSFEEILDSEVGSSFGWKWSPTETEFSSESLPRYHADEVSHFWNIICMGIRKPSSPQGILLYYLNNVSLFVSQTHWRLFNSDSPVLSPVTDTALTRFLAQLAIGFIIRTSSGLAPSLDVIQKVLRTTLESSSLLRCFFLLFQLKLRCHSAEFATSKGNDIDKKQYLQVHYWCVGPYVRVIFYDNDKNFQKSYQVMFN